MSVDKNINLETAPNATQQVNGLGVTQFVEKKYAGAAGAEHVYSVDANGEHHISHEDVLGAYGHVALPDSVKRKIKSLDDPDIPAAQKDQIRDNLASWQDQQIQDWQAQNPDYDPNNPNFTPVVFPPNANQAPLPLNPNMDPALANILQSMQQLLAQNQQMLNLLQQLIANQQPNPNQQPAVTPEQQAVIDAEAAPNNPNQQPAVTPEQQAVMDAEAALEDARKELLEITIRRKTRGWEGLTPSGRNDEADYANAMAIYNQALNNLLAARTALQTANANIAGQNPPDQAEIARREMRESYAEQRKFVDLEHQMGEEAIDNSNWRRKFLRKVSRLSTKKKIGIGLLVGAGAAVSSAALGLGIAGLAVGAAARFSWVLLNKKASVRNVSEHSRDQMRAEIDRQRRRLDALAAGGVDLVQHAGFANVDDYRQQELVNGVQNDYEGSVAFAQRRQKMGGLVVGASAALILVGVGGELGMLPNPHLDLPFHGDISGIRQHLPGWLPGHQPPQNHLAPGASTVSGAEGLGPVHVGGGSGFPSGTEGLPGGPGGLSSITGNLHHLPANFHADTFKGVSGDEAVRHALLGGGGLKSVFASNNIQVHGVNTTNIRQINLELARERLPMASGVGLGGNQNIVDWTASNTVNSGASADQGFRIINGSSRGGWEKLMEVAQRHGVTFTRTGGA